MTRWSRPKSDTPSARHTLARDAYAIRYNIKNIVQALDNDQRLSLRVSSQNQLRTS
jgi:hypothetical protein